LIPLNDWSPLGGLESDVRVVSETWFEHEDHDLGKQFVCSILLTGLLFGAQDYYTGSIRYETETLFVYLY